MSKDRFDKFTERARQVLTLAQQEAIRLNHNTIDTEHLLLGLVREGEGAAAMVLVRLGVELANVHSAMEYVIGRIDRKNADETGLTPRGKKVIELAVDEARQLRNDYIGTEHLLLGLIREGEGIAAGVLESLGVDLGKARAATVQVLEHARPHRPDDVPRSPADTPPRDAAAPSPFAPPQPTPMQWEYMDIQVGWPTHDAGGYVKWINGKEDARFGKNKTLVCNALSILGAEGWELVAVDNPNGHGTNDPHYLLKRPTSLTSSAWLAWFATAVAPRTMQAPESPVRRRRPWRTDGPARIWSRSRRR